MPQRRSALGRGLGALLPDATAPPPLGSAPVPDAAGALRELPLEAIAPNPEQPRRVFDEAELDALADSIRRHGLMQPVVVRHAPGAVGAPGTAGARYQIVAGERRLRASRKLGHTTIPALLQDIAPAALLEAALVENVQRRDLNPVELAFAFRALCDGGLTQEEVGQRVGLERSTVTNHLRLLELPRELQQDMESGALTLGHAKVLLSLTDAARRHRLRDLVLRDGLSVRATERAARQMAQPPPRRAQTKPAAADPNQRALLRSLEDRLQTRVRIRGDGRRGHIEIDFASPEEFERIWQTIQGGAARL